MIKKFIEYVLTMIAIVFTFLTFISFCNIFKAWCVNVLGQAVLTVFLLCISMLLYFVAQDIHDSIEEDNQN